MDNENELNRPLKRHPANATGNRSFKLLFVIAGLLLLASLPVFQFYGGFSRLGNFADSKKTIEVTDKMPEKPVEADNPAEPEKVPVRNHDVDPDQGGLQPVKPDGALVEAKPLPAPLPKVSEVRQEQALAHLPDPELVERGAGGVIPKRSKEGLRAMDVYSRQPDTEGNFGVARVVIVIAGMGISQTSTQDAIRKLPGSVTLAFAPYGNSLARWMQMARKSGHELLLQVPMEPLGYPANNPGPHTLKADAELLENLTNLHWSMSRITNYVGITNYLGNRLLAQPASLRPLFDEISERGLLFFEDGSVKNSTAEGVALKSLLPYAKADFLIDNVRSRSAIGEKLNKLAEQAKRTGLAIGVGNAFPDTIAMVAEFTRRAKENGIEITPVSAVVKDPKR